MNHEVGQAGGIIAPRALILSSLLGQPHRKGLCDAIGLPSALDNHALCLLDLYAAHFCPITNLPSERVSLGLQLLHLIAYLLNVLLRECTWTYCAWLQIRRIG